MRIQETFQKYLKIIWKGILCQFGVLSNGLRPSPGQFIIILKPSLAELS